MKRNFVFVMAVAALVILLSGGPVFANTVKGDFATLPSGRVFTYTVTGDFTTTPCTATLSTGGDLWTLLQGTCGGIRLPSPPPPINPTNDNWIEGDYVLVTAWSGSTALYSVGELDPKYAPDAVTLTVQKNGMIDLAGEGRAVRAVRNVDVVHAVPVVRAGQRFFSTELVVSGVGIAPQTFDLADLEGMTQETYTNIAGATWTGPTLLNVLKASGVNTRNMNGYVIVQATDGYATVLSMYEATHLTGTQDALLAISASDGSINGGGTKDNGLARLVLPNDKTRGRWVSNIYQIVVHTLEHQESDKDH